MGHIIAGRFDIQEHAEEVARALEGLGISRNRIAIFYVNPDGQHHLLPMGGDKSASPGASKSGKGAWVGTGVGAAAGAAVGSVAGPVGTVVGAGVGAYTGSLAGAVSETDMKPESADKAAPDEDRAVDRESGVHVAAEVDDKTREKVVALLRQHNGDQIEEAQGTIEDGEWVDFDPTQPARLVP